MIKRIMFAILTMVVISSCTDTTLFMSEEIEGPVNPSTKPYYYDFKTNDCYDVLDKDGNIFEANVPYNGDGASIETEEPKVHGGNHPLNLIDSFITVNSDGKYPIKYSVEGIVCSYIATVKGCTIKYKDAYNETHNLIPYKELKISIEEYSNDINKEPFTQKFVSSNSLMYEDILLDMATQEIEVTETEKYIEGISLIKDEHLYIEEDAELKNNELFVNEWHRLTFEIHWSNDSTSQTTFELKVTHVFGVTFNEITGDPSKLIGKTFDVIDGKVDVLGYMFNKSRIIIEEAEMDGINISEYLKACPLDVKTATVLSDEKVLIKIYDNNPEDCAKETLPLNIKNPEVTLVKTEWNVEHTNFIRVAEISNEYIYVFCDNIITFIEYYSDGSKKETSVSFRVKHTFAFSGTVFEVENLSNVIGKTYNIAGNGTVTIENNNISIIHIKSEVVGPVMYEGKDYAKEITTCVTQARTLTINSVSNMTIRFFNDNANDYAEGDLSVNITEAVVLEQIKKEFTCMGFNEASLNGNIISLMCKNMAKFIKVYSDNTQEQAAEVPYNWGFTYIANIPVFYSHKMDGKTYYFNAGYTDVEGQDVSVTISSKEISDIFFENINYKDEAPECTVTVESISFREGFADITFRKGKNTQAVTVPIYYKTAETLDGEIVAGWMTDSFTDQYKNYEGTYLHIMACVNESYVIYSKTIYSREDILPQEGWTTTKLSLAEGANLLNSRRAAAWYYDKHKEAYFMGSVTSFNDQKERLILEYYLLDGNLAYRLGYNPETLSGEKYRNPIRETAVNKDGIWEINGQIFAGSN